MNNEVKDVVKHTSTWLSWMTVILVFGILIGCVLFNKYTEYRVEDAIRQGSVVYKQYDSEKDTFDIKKKEVYKILKSSTIPMIVESPTK